LLELCDCHAGNRVGRVIDVIHGNSSVESVGERKGRYSVSPRDVRTTPRRQPTRS
jgi:hypothetical protein